MAGILGRFRAAKADVRIESNVETPPEESSGGVARLTVTLHAKQSIKIRSGHLELALLATRFSRTVLDGYHEYTSEKVWRTIDLCREVQAQPDVALVFTSELRLPNASAPDSHPLRMQWRARARFQVAGHRELRASAVLRDACPYQQEGPVVDGRRFLPLYEFRSGPDS